MRVLLVVVVGVLFGWSAAEAATCTEGQLPYSAGGFFGATQADACTAWANGSGVSFTGTEVRNNDGVSETWCDASSLGADRPADTFVQVATVCDVAPPDPPTETVDASTATVRVYYIALYFTLFLAFVFGYRQGRAGA